ncbi:type II secretion system protein [Campylobacterota bacterium DY0563]
MKSNKAFSLLELILVIFISSFVLIFVFKFSKDLYLAESETREISILKIDLNSTKIIIEKDLPNIINKLKYKDTTLYIDDKILLKDVSNFSLIKGTQKVIIDITLDDKISQKWEFEL